ncbi:DUF7563 family protein [Halobaculum sp. D14]|uniref:DUF7563 family protein n=1 Tax=unclassified Halobaculum TaxID=2640896 RepID=UPI003EBB2C31
MPECANCGEYVSDDYLRVFTPESMDQPRCCPFCDDKIRDGGRVRDARSTRQPRRGASGAESDRDR